MKWSTAHAEVSARPSELRAQSPLKLAEAKSPHDNREMDPFVTDVDLSMSLVDPLPKNQEVLSAPMSDG